MPCIHSTPGTPHAKRATPHPGPRCVTCWRGETRRRRQDSHGRYIEQTYGITSDEYTVMHRSQGGVCAICGPWTGRRGVSRALAVDHDHRTGEVRGLLCPDCNRALGMWRDNPDVFRRAAEYLTEPPARRVLKGRDWSAFRGAINSSKGNRWTKRGR